MQNLRRTCGMLAMLAVLTGASPAGAEAYTWNGSVNDDWFEGANWTPAGPPPAGAEAVYDGAGTPLLLTNETPVLSSFTLQDGTLTCSNWTTRIQATNVTIEGGTISLPGPFTNNVMSNRVWIVCPNDFRLGSNAMIEVSFKGYAHGNGPGAGLGTYYGSGGNHGGQGGRAIDGTAPRPDLAGELDGPILPGSGGGGTKYKNGHGGGAVRIEAGGTATIFGSILANGKVGSGGPAGRDGGGAGGSIYITCNLFGGSTNGLLNVTGGNGGSRSGVLGGGGGGGGRIAVDYVSTTRPGVRFSTAGGAGWANEYGDMRWRDAAGNGTLWIPNTNLLSDTLANGLFGNVLLHIGNATQWNVSSLTVSNCSVRFAEDGFILDVTGNLTIDAGGSLGIGMMDGFSNSVLSCSGNLLLTNGGALQVYAGLTNGANTTGALVEVAGNMLVGPDSWVRPYSHGTNGGSVVFRMADLAIAETTNGGFNADAAGYDVHQGPGKGISTFYVEGAGYGGHGGVSCVGTIGALAYGSAAAPIDPGSGGGGEYNQGFPGLGGGAIRIEASGMVTVHGIMKADGANGLGKFNGGSGSGGAIYIQCDTFAGSTNGILRAGGGEGGRNGTTYNHGAGGGGRIAVDYGALGAQGVRFAAPCGLGYANNSPTSRVYWKAQDGTLHLSDAGLLSGVIDKSRFSNVRLFISETTSWAVNSLTVRDSSFVFAEDGFSLVVTNGLAIGPNASLGIGAENGSVRPSLSCGGNLLLTNGGALLVYASVTNATISNYGAKVQVAGDTIVGGSSWIYPYANRTNGGSVFFDIGSLAIATNGGFDAQSRGYGKGYGTGAGGANSLRASGGGYGGKGGASSDSVAGGITYGSTNAPLHIGSGAGYRDLSGAGGGLVWIHAAGPVVCNGAILADGQSTSQYRHGGGSGGGIFVACTGPFSGSSTNATVSATGGAGGSEGGAGGGGRIAIWYKMPAAVRDTLLAGGSVPPSRLSTSLSIAAFSGTISVTNGLGHDNTEPDCASPGSTYFLQSIPPCGTIFLFR